MADAVEIELEGPAFEVLADFLAGRRDDIQTVATTLGVSREDFSRALLRSVTSRGHSFHYGSMLQRLGIAPDEFVAYATLHGGQIVPRLSELAPELFGESPAVPPPPPVGSKFVSVGARAFTNFDVTRMTIDPSSSLSPVVSADAGKPTRSIVARRYEIGERLGKGGQATVYRVFDLALRRPAAMKLFHLAEPTSDSEHSAASGFRSASRPVTAAPEPRSGPGIDRHTCREVGLLCGPARQAGVLPLLDWGCEGEQPFLIFPLCASDLSDRRRELGRVDPHEAAGWILQAAEALEKLHGAGIVHADVKPHNLLLDETGRVLLTDLGLARVMGDPEPDQMMGSLSYMSPEQLCIQPLSGQTDIYSLGVSLYELLAGRPPYPIFRLSRDEIETLRRRVLFEEPPPLPADIPDRLKEICRKAMARDPAERFQTASQLSRSLRRWRSPGWRGFFQRLTDRLRGRARKSGEAVTPRPPDIDVEEGGKWLAEERADRLRYQLLACAEAGDWRLALGLVDLAWAEHTKLEWGEPAAFAQFLWDASRVCARGGDRDRAIRFARLARDAYRALGSPMETFVSLLLADWQAAR